jgi:hypothetical protein
MFNAELRLNQSTVHRRDSSDPKPATHSSDNACEHSAGNLAPSRLLTKYL